MAGASNSCRPYTSISSPLLMKVLKHIDICRLLHQKTCDVFTSMLVYISMISVIEHHLIKRLKNMLVLDKIKQYLFTLMQVRFLLCGEGTLLRKNMQDSFWIPIKICVRQNELFVFYLFCSKFIFNYVLLVWWQCT